MGDSAPPAGASGASTQEASDVAAMAHEEGGSGARPEASARAVLARQPPDPVFVDILRPGTVIANAHLDMPEHHILRILASCTLLNVRVTGAGFLTHRHFGFEHYGLVEVGAAGVRRGGATPADDAARPQVCQEGPTGSRTAAEAPGAALPRGPRIAVHLERVHLQRCAHGNGVRVHGAAALRMDACTVQQCKRNGVIVCGAGASAELRDCLLAQNEASGLWVFGGGRAAMLNTHCTDNQCNGAACWDTGSRLDAVGCRFQNNCTNGARLLYGAVGALRGCQFDSNSQQGLEVGLDAAVRLAGGQVHGNIGHGVWAYNGGYLEMHTVSVNRGLAMAQSVYACRPDTVVVLDGCHADGTVAWDEGGAVMRTPESARPTGSGSCERLREWARR